MHIEIVVEKKEMKTKRTRMKLSWVRYILFYSLQNLGRDRDRRFCPNRNWTRIWPSEPNKANIARLLPSPLSLPTQK